MKIKTIGGHRLICIIGILAAAVCISSEAKSQNSSGVIIDLTSQVESDFELIDLGLRADGSLGAVGNGTDATGDNVARLVDVAADRLSFSSSIFQGLGADVNVRGISSDVSHAAGFSDSPISIDFEGISWDLSDSYLSPEGIGFVSGFAQNSIALGAWTDGVVGNHSGVSDAVTFSSSSGLSVLPDSGGISEARDASSNGSIIVGVSSDFGAIVGASFWDSSGINQLDDSFGISSIAASISPNASFIGGELAFFEPATFQTGTQAAIWSGSSYDLTLLQEEDASGNLIRLLGQVNDVSNSGWAVGETVTGGGFI